MCQGRLITSVKHLKNASKKVLLFACCVILLLTSVLIYDGMTHVTTVHTGHGQWVMLYGGYLVVAWGQPVTPAGWTRAALKGSAPLLFWFSPPLQQGLRVELPLAAVVLCVLAGIVTTVLYSTQPQPKGFCDCGYYLQGNITGCCPECGRATLGRGVDT